MKILLIHRNFPAQFVHIANYLRQAPENQVVFLSNRKDVEMQGCHKVLFSQKRTAWAETHQYLRFLENGVLEGQAAFEAALELRNQGFIPDVILGHSGWGAPMFIKDVFPEAPFIGYFEWFYRSQGADVDFLNNGEVSPDDKARLRMKNATILLDLQSADVGITPTYWQHSQFPTEYAAKLSVIHDGVDTLGCSPQPGTKLVLSNKGLDLSGVSEIITYVSRGMEPYRGFPEFMLAIEKVLVRRPNCHVVIVGSENVFYGVPAEEGKSFKELMLERLKLDMKRIHFTGQLPKSDYIRVLQASSVHVYLTVPFVLSWSMLEAMACGCTLVASQTPPVCEAINDNVNGLLFDFHNIDQLAERIEEALMDRRRSLAIGQRARQTILDRYALSQMLPRQIHLIQHVINAKREREI